MGAGRAHGQGGYRLARERSEWANPHACRLDRASELTGKQ